MLQEQQLEQLMEKYMQFIHVLILLQDKSMKLEQRLLNLMDEFQLSLKMEFEEVLELSKIQIL
jgi:hypothetical protein